LFVNQLMKKLDLKPLVLIFLILTLYLKESSFAKFNASISNSSLTRTVIFLFFSRLDCILFKNEDQSSTTNLFVLDSF